MKKDIIKFPHATQEESFKGPPEGQIDLLGEGILKIPSAEFMRKKL